MVWFGMEGSESSTVNRLYNHQAGILPLNRGRYRATRAATKYKNIKIYIYQNGGEHRGKQGEDENHRVF